MESCVDFRSLIDVRSPYYALQAVETASAGVIQAKVLREQPLGHEVGPIASAEVGRHLAIAGACACSSIRQPAALHYYLAHRATIVRHHDPLADHAREFEITSQAVSSSQREARAHSTLTAVGREQPLYELDVTYKVLARSVFQRLFAAHKRELRARPRAADAAADPLQIARRDNPYVRLLPLQVTERSGEVIRAVLPEVTPAMCAGHFAMYPALPVAILMHTLSSLAGEALRERWGRSMRYRMQRADVYADQLAFAGERLEFDARYLGSLQHGERYEARVALGNGQPIGRLVIDLDAIPAVSSVQRPQPTFELASV